MIIYLFLTCSIQWPRREPIWWPRRAGQIWSRRQGGSRQVGTSGLLVRPASSYLQTQSVSDSCKETWTDFCCASHVMISAGLRLRPLNQIGQSGLFLLSNLVNIKSDGFHFKWADMIYNTTWNYQNVNWCLWQYQVWRPRRFRRRQTWWWSWLRRTSWWPRWRGVQQRSLRRQELWWRQRQWPYVITFVYSFNCWFWQARNILANSS